MNIYEVKIYQKVHRPFKEVILCPTFLLCLQSHHTGSSMLAISHVHEHRLVLALGPWLLLFPLLGVHISWSFNWLPPTHYSGFNSNVTSSRKHCLTLDKVGPFPQFLSSTWLYFNFP